MGAAGVENSAVNEKGRASFGVGTGSQREILRDGENGGACAWAQDGRLVGMHLRWTGTSASREHGHERCQGTPCILGVICS